MAIDQTRECPYHGKSIQRLDLQSEEIYVCIWSSCDYRETVPREEEPEEDKDPLGWWAISGSNLLALLRRAHAGEDPDFIYAEEYANGHVEYPGDDGSSPGGEGS